MTIAPAAFRQGGEVPADDRSRIAVNRVSVTKDTRHVVAVNDDGDVLRALLASIPRRELIVRETRRELIVRENGPLFDSLARGLAQSAAGDTVHLGSFAAYTENGELEE